jgi:glutathione S-transferase
MSCAYVGLAVSFTEVDDTLNPPEYLAVSPFKRSPVVEHQGCVAVDSASARYVLHSTPALPVTLRNRSVVESAVETILATLTVEATTAVSGRVFIPRRANRPVDHVAVSAAVERFKAYLPTMEQNFFQESAWVVGKEVTLADLTLASAIFVIQNVIGVPVALADTKLGAFWAVAQKQPFFTDSMRSFTVTALKVQKQG